MSLQSVFDKCTTLLSDEEMEQQRDLFVEEIEKQMRRFEKILYTYSFEGESMAMWNMIKHDGQTASEAKRAHFELFKSHYAHRYLEMLCDLYDYKVNYGKEETHEG